MKILIITIMLVYSFNILACPIVRFYPFTCNNIKDDKKVSFQVKRFVKNHNVTYIVTDFENDTIYNNVQIATRTNSRLPIYHVNNITGEKVFDIFIKGTSFGTNPRPDWDLKAVHSDEINSVDLKCSYDNSIR